MSSIFYVSYENTTKKVTCPSNNSINKLIALSVLKFNLPSSTSASLIYNGRQLEGILSIRSSNLLNNAKLDLKKNDSSVPITIKINGMCLGKSNSSILKVSPSTTIAYLIDLYLEKCGDRIEWVNNNVELCAMQSRISNSSTDFNSTTVGNLVGTVSSVALRLVVENMAEKKLKEDALRKEESFRQEKERQRIAATQKLKEERENKEETKGMAHENQEVDPTPETNHNRQEMVIMTDQASEPIGITQEGSTVMLNQLTSKHTKDLHESKNDEISLMEQTEPIVTEEYNSIGRSTHDQGASFISHEETEDTLYVPNGRIDAYENPEDDYVLTASHAEKYLKLIRGMQKPTKKSMSLPPTRYIFRLRFPDRTFLDLIMEDSAMALGQLFKKIDSYIHPKFLNSYVLKNGTPPFETIEMGFAQNNVPLKDHPSFQQEKILLIWEPVISQTGPYFNEGLQPKDLKEMPTVALESHRQNLEDDSKSLRKTINEKANAHKVEENPKRKAGLPKWFRP